MRIISFCGSTLPLRHWMSKEENHYISLVYYKLIDVYTCSVRFCLNFWIHCLHIDSGCIQEFKQNLTDHVFTTDKKVIITYCKDQADGKMDLPFWSVNQVCQLWWSVQEMLAHLKKRLLQPHISTHNQEANIMPSLLLVYADWIFGGKVQVWHSLFHLFCTEHMLVLLHKKTLYSGDFQFQSSLMGDIWRFPPWGEWLLLIFKLEPARSPA